MIAEFGVTSGGATEEGNGSKSRAGTGSVACRGICCLGEEGGGRAALPQTVSQRLLSADRNRASMTRMFPTAVWMPFSTAPPVRMAREKASLCRPY